MSYVLEFFSLLCDLIILIIQNSFLFGLVTVFVAYGIFCIIKSILGGITYGD